MKACQLQSCSYLLQRAVGVVYIARQQAAAHMGFGGAAHSVIRKAIRHVVRRAVVRIVGYGLKAVVFVSVGVFVLLAAGGSGYLRDAARAVVGILHLLAVGIGHGASQVGILIDIVRDRFAARIGLRQDMVAVVLIGGAGYDLRGLRIRMPQHGTNHASMFIVRKFLQGVNMDDMQKRSFRRSSANVRMKIGFLFSENATDFIFKHHLIFFLCQRY